MWILASMKQHTTAVLHQVLIYSVSYMKFLAISKTGATVFLQKATVQIMTLVSATKSKPSAISFNS